MLLWRIGVALVLEQGERADEFGSCLGRLDYFVDETALGGYVRIGKFSLEFIYTGSAG